MGRLLGLFNQNSALILENKSFVNVIGIIIGMFCLYKLGYGLGKFIFYITN